MDLDEKFKDINIWEIAEFWIKTYPDDVFVNGPYPIVEIRELFKEMLKKKSTRKIKDNINLLK